MDYLKFSKNLIKNLRFGNVKEKLYLNFIKVLVMNIILAKNTPRVTRNKYPKYTSFAYKTLIQYLINSQ
jgi:hypothetical protein